MLLLLSMDLTVAIFLVVYSHDDQWIGVAVA